MSTSTSSPSRSASSVVIVEIRAAEGGDDAKDLVLHQLGIYGRLVAKQERL